MASMADISAVPRTRDAAEPGPEPLWRHLLGHSLRERRKDLDQTLGEVAARAGVSPQYLSEIERGIKEPSSEVIAAVSGALGTTLLDLTVDVAQSLTVVRPRTRQLFTGPSALALAA